MKSDRKSANELNCLANNGIVKEESGIDPNDINGSNKVTGSCANSELHELGDQNNTGSKNSDEKTSRNQKTNTNTNNQQTLNPVKLENNSSYPACNLSNADCGGGSTPKGDPNGVGKCGRNGGGGGESQFMQQQSHIFVFSTMLANKGAEAVLRGQFPSIVAYHCAQPGTKKFLEKHPNKGNKFGQSPVEWLNNFGPPTGSQKIAQTSQNNLPRRTPDLTVLDPDPPSFWNEQTNIRNSNNDKPLSNNESSVDDTIDKVVNSQPSPSSLGETGCPISGGAQPSLQGVKVPDENLTPQQRQHREEQLATIRKMQILLFSNRKEEAEVSTAQNTGEQTPQSFVQTAGGSPSDNSLENFSSGVDWDKIENQLFDPKDNKVTSTDNSTTTTANVVSGTRSQGPPPPYHNQSSRPASVPASALQTSNPSSPNNPTSTLSLPSPRANSGVNSPADCSRFNHSGTGQRSGGYLPAGSPMNQDSLNSVVVSSGIENSSNRSNPGTPASHSHLVTFSPAPPSTTQKDSIDFASGQPSPSVEDIFCQTLQSVDQEQRDQVAKEANLMPVPSPQQIQYLNTFEGQELTIQKQANTSLKEGSNPPANVSNSGMRIHTEGGSGQCGSLSMSGGSPMTDNGDRSFAAPLPSPRTPRTPTHSGFDSSTTGGRMSSGQNSPAASYGQSLTRVALPESPKSMKELSPSTGKNKQLLQQHHQVNNDGTKISQEFFNRQSNGGRGQVQHDHNLPLNPNNVNNCLGVQGASSASHFDPITSLAQMSQQLASLAPSGMSDGGIIHSGNPGALQDMSNAAGEFGDSGFTSGFGGGCMPCSTSYGPPPPRPQSLQGITSRAPSNHSQMSYAAMQHPVGGYHNEPRGPPRTNVQVKPGAPNTIQYLPAAKPSQCNPGGPRPPPSLDFLQGFANNNPNQRLFPNNSQPGYIPGVGRPQRPTGFHPTVNYNNTQMMRASPINNPAMRMQHMVGGGVFPGNKPFPGDIGAQMMSNQIPQRMQYMPTGPGIPSMRPRGPAQPMHSNIESANNFKNGPFQGPPPGPPTSDPNYAQQYHNFQQQLYATGTRGNVPQHSGLHNSPSFLPER